MRQYLNYIVAISVRGYFSSPPVLPYPQEDPQSPPENYGGELADCSVKS